MRDPTPLREAQESSKVSCTKSRKFFDHGMTWGYRTLIRPVLFSQDSEKIHDRTMGALAWASRHAAAGKILAALYQPPNLPVKVFGLDFPNPVGLAAGMDKHAAAVPMWENLGFGFAELGGVTWLAQPGNPAPRMFRAVPDQALINRMGFNNEGAEAMAVKLQSLRARGRWPAHPVGINLGKSKITPLADAPGDYAKSLQVLWPHADFFVINVSSPNTPGLRELQDRAALDEILAELQKVNQHETLKSTPAKTPKPVLVKIAPDLSFEALDEILALVASRNIAGIVATNTTLARPVSKDLRVVKIYAETGGLSGRPLNRRSNEVIAHIWRQTAGKVPIIGVGGVFSAEDAWTKLAAGANLVQLYTGLVFEGPGLVKEIVGGLQNKMKDHHVSNISEIVGTDNKQG